MTPTPHDMQIHADPDLWWRAPRTVVGQGGLQVLLSEREARILGALVMAVGSPVSREVLASLINPDNPRAVDYAVRRIRTKVEPNPLDPVVIQSVQGIGYRIATVGGSAFSESYDPDQRLVLADRWVDLSSGVVRGHSGEQSLTPLQRALLQRLLEADGTTLSRLTLLQDVWGSVASSQRRLVDTVVRQLRAVLEVDSARPAHLLSARGVGYRLVVPHRLSNLTPPLWDGIGRSETTTLCDLTDSHRWVSIVGPPGCGKSWLARQVALRKRTTLPGGVWWVDVAHCASIDDVVRRLCDVLHVPSQSVSSDGAHLRAAMAVRPERLLVLDGLPSDLNANALLRSLATHDRMRLLVTTVQSPNTTDSWLFQVPELSADTARRLFVATFQAGGGRSTLDSAAIDSVCEAVRFNPKAIELAAQRAVHEGVTSTTALIDTNALQYMLAESLRGAPEASRHALTQLGVFKGAFTSDDAVHVANVDASVVATLVERQLLTRPRPGWLQVYGLAADALPEPDFAAERRHATHVRGLFVRAHQQFRTRHGRAARRECQRRVADGLAACRWWLTSDTPTLGVDVLLAVLDCLGDAAPDGFDLLQKALEGPAFEGRDRLWLAYAQSRRVDVRTANAALLAARNEGADTTCYAYRYAQLLVRDRQPTLPPVDIGPEPQTHPEQIDWLIARTRTLARGDVEQAIGCHARARAVAKTHGDDLGLLQADYALAHVWQASMRAPETAANHFARLRPRFLAEGREQGAVACAFLAADMWLEVGEVQAALETLLWVDEMAVHLPVVGAMAYPELVRLRALVDTLDPTELIERTTAAATAQIERGELWFAANFQILTRIAWARLGNVAAATAAPDWPSGHVDIDMVFDALCSAVDSTRGVPEPRPIRWSVAHALVAAVRDGHHTGTPTVAAIAGISLAYRLVD